MNNANYILIFSCKALGLLVLFEYNLFMCLDSCVISCVLIAVSFHVS